MAEYIEREAAIERLKRRRDSEKFPKTKYAGLESAIFQIKHIPAADVVEVRRGKWVYHEKVFNRFQCSNCGSYAFERYKHCPNCCAKMDGKGEG